MLPLSRSCCEAYWSFHYSKTGGVCKRRPQYRGKEEKTAASGDRSSQRLCCQCSRNTNENTEDGKHFREIIWAKRVSISSWMCCPASPRTDILNVVSFPFIHSPTKEKRISFADEHGKNIADVSLWVFAFPPHVFTLVLRSTNCTIWSRFIPYRMYTASSYTTPQPATTPRKCKKGAVQSANTERIAIRRPCIYYFVMYRYTDWIWWVSLECK